MKVPVSCSLVALYNKAHKNYNYSLEFLLNSLDTVSSIKTLNLLESFQLHGEKEEIDIDASNINAIKSIFKIADFQLIERLLWVAAMFPEI